MSAAYAKPIFDDAKYPSRSSLSFGRFRSKSFRQKTGNATAHSGPSEGGRPATPDLPPGASGKPEENELVSYGGPEAPGSADKVAFEELMPPSWPEHRPYQRCYCEENTYLLVQQLLLGLEKKLGQSRKDQNGWVWDVWVAFVSNADQKVLLWQQRASNSEHAALPIVWDYHVFAMVSAKRPDVEQRTASDTKNDSTELDAQTSKKRMRGFGFLQRMSSAKKSSEQDHPFKWDDCVVPAPSTKDVGPFTQSNWRGWVYDVDSRLCHSARQECGSTTLSPVPFESYVQQTFAAYDDTTVPQVLQPSFRLASGQAFLDNFASDRSHMLLPPILAQDSRSEDAAKLRLYSAPPPEWAPLSGSRAKRKGWKHNLMSHWVSMSDSGRQSSLQAPELEVQFGQVLHRETFYRGGWKQAPWRRRRPATASGTSGHNGRGHRRQVGEVEDGPPPIERVTSYRRIHTTSALDAQRGGRVTSPLFPAYLHNALQARAARDRQSYLALRVREQETQDDKDEVTEASDLYQSSG